MTDTTPPDAGQTPPNTAAGTAARATIKTFAAGMALRMAQLALSRAQQRVRPEHKGVTKTPAGTLMQSVATLAIAQVGTRSLPGAALVGTGLLAKALYERRQKRRALAALESARAEQGLLPPPDRKA